GQRQFARLEIFLEAGLGVLAVGLRPLECELWNEPAAHMRNAQFETTVEIQRTYQCFERIGKNGVAIGAAGFEFAESEAQVLTELQVARQLRQRSLLHEAGTKSTEFAFAGFGIGFEQQLGNDHAENSITQKFHALVVVLARAAMAQSALQKCRVSEFVCQLALERFHLVLVPSRLKGSGSSDSGKTSAR